MPLIPLIRLALHYTSSIFGAASSACSFPAFSSLEKEQREGRGMEPGQQCCLSQFSLK